MPTKTYSIVGMNHRGSEALVAALKDGTEVRLVREPDNKFDKLAVAVWVDGKHVGYIPSKQNKALAAFIDQAGTDFGVPVIAQDQAVDVVQEKSIGATFVRSPNSGYPMVKVVD